MSLSDLLLAPQPSDVLILLLSLGRNSAINLCQALRYSVSSDFFNQIIDSKPKFCFLCHKAFFHHSLHQALDFRTMHQKRLARSTSERSTCCLLYKNMFYRAPSNFLDLSIVSIVVFLNIPPDVLICKQSNLLAFCQIQIRDC